MVRPRKNSASRSSNAFRRRIYRRTRRSERRDEHRTISMTTGNRARLHRSLGIVLRWISRLRFVPCERNGVGCRTSRAFCVDAGHACPDQAGVMLRTVPSTRPRYEIRRGDATWMRAGFSRCSSRSQKCFGTTGTRACAKAGRRCRRCRRDRNPRTRVERAIVGDCTRLRTNEFLRLASRRFLRFRFVLRERKAGEAGTKPDGG